MGRPGGRPHNHSALQQKWRLRRRVVFSAVAIAFCMSLLCLPSCNTPQEAPHSAIDKPWAEALADKLTALEAAPQGEAGPGLTWYQVFVYSFYDSNGDGIGDLNGVTERLDYIQSMGFDGIWLSPIHPSSTYHKYNVRDYFEIDPEYGTLDDFDELIKACRERGLKVLLDLVINHTDLNHPWFTGHREYYNISDKPGNGNWERLPDGRYYECQFWGQMPDLNLESGEVRAELEKVFGFWLDRGVDGFRLDAIKDYFSGDIARNVEALSWLSDTIKRIEPGAYIVGEVWENTNALYQYYDSGVDSFFSFPFAGADGTIAKLMLLANTTMSDYLQKTADAYNAAKSRNAGATNAPFFTNHDMSRAAGFLRKDAKLIKTAWGLSLTQPGDAFVYYGEELGMSGSGKDENKRAPMYWTEGFRADGMANGPPGMDDMSHSFPPAFEQIGDPDSIFTYIREVIYLRNKYPHIGRGSYDVIPVAAGSKAGAVLRVWQGSEIVVAYNVSSEQESLVLPGLLVDFVSATGERPQQKDDLLTLPGYCIAILR